MVGVVAQSSSVVERLPVILAATVVARGRDAGRKQRPGSRVRWLENGDETVRMGFYSGDEKLYLQTPARCATQQTTNVLFPTQQKVAASLTAECISMDPAVVTAFDYWMTYKEKQTMALKVYYE